MDGYFFQPTTQSNSRQQAGLRHMRYAGGSISDGEILVSPAVRRAPHANLKYWEDPSISKLQMH